MKISIMEATAMTDAGMIYLHVPFCARRCIYCDFYSTTLSEEVRKQYVKAAQRELKERVSYLPSTHICTIYFGGGTPSQLSTEEIASLLDCIRAHYDVASDAEITLECNPDDVTQAFAIAIKEIGINRVSLGVQSFDDGILHLLNRRHNAREAEEAVRTLYENGLENISIDLIYGLPRQDVTSFSTDLNKAFALPIKHLSSYALSVEKGTPLAKRIEEKALNVASEETFVTEYTLLMEQAEKHGFIHYEISNFALQGFESKHNSGYWDGTPYLGIGPGAHSFDGTNRRYNLPQLLDYIKQSAEGIFPHQTELLKDYERYNEWIFTSLRTSKGLSLQLTERRYGRERLNYLLSNAQPHISSGRIIKEGNRLKIARDSIMVSDDIISDLMMDETIH